MKTAIEWSKQLVNRTYQADIADIIAQAQADAIASVLVDVEWVTDGEYGEYYCLEMTESNFDKWVDLASELNGKR